MARPSSSSWLLSRLHGRRHRRGRRLRLCARDCLARCLGQPSSSSSSSLSSKFGPLVGRRWKRGGPFSRSHTRSLMHTHTRIRTYTYTLSISSSRRVPPPSYGEKGRYYIGGILVLARLGPRQFWEWSSKNSRGKSCLCAAAATAAAEQLPALLLLRPHRRRRRRRVAASRSSRYRPGLDNVVIVLPSWSSSSSSSVSRPRDFRGHPRRARIRRDYLLGEKVSLFSSLLSLSWRNRDTLIENRARGTFATTRGDRLAAPLIIYTRSRASDGGLLIQLAAATQKPPGLNLLLGTTLPLLLSPCLFSPCASRYPRIYFFARGNYFWCLFPRFVNIHSLTLSIHLSFSLSPFRHRVLPCVTLRRDYSLSRAKIVTTCLAISRSRF